MFAKKLSNRESGLILYGITPPKAEQTTERIREIAHIQSTRALALGVDGLVIYDLQDESSRNGGQRPFPFTPTIDAWTFANEYLDVAGLSKIVYCSVGKRDPEAMKNMFEALPANDALVLVGLPSRNEKALMNLSDAYELWNNVAVDSRLGGVAIAERHAADNNEHLRLIGKIVNGCSYFITQCVYSADYMKQLVTDLCAECVLRQVEMPTLIFTLTPCGSAKTLQFLNWLGIHVPGWLAEELHQSHDILARSVEISTEIAREMAEFCYQRDVPFGFNIESVSARKVEIEASEQLLMNVKEVLSGYFN